MVDYLQILKGREEYLPIYDQIAECLNDIAVFPELIEPIYRIAINLDEALLEKMRFGLLRVQLHSEIFRNQDMEESQKMRYVAEMIERTIFGGLFVERDSYAQAD